MQNGRVRRALVIAALAGCGDNGLCPIREIEGPQAMCGDSECAPIEVTRVAAASSLVLTPTHVAWLEDRPDGDYILSRDRASVDTRTLDIIPFFAGSVTHLRAHGTTLGWNRGAEVVLQAEDATRRSFEAEGFFSGATFAFDDTYVYLPINNNTSEGKPIDGNGPARRWPIGIIDVAATPGGALIANCHGVWRAPVDGSEPVKLSSGLCAFSLGTHDRVVVANAYDDQCGAYGAFRLESDPSEPRQLVMRPEQQLGAGFAVDDKYAYFSTESGAWRVPLGGGQPRKLVDGTIAGIAVDASEIYVLADERLVRIAK
jgi:hypothetical protein